MGMREEMTFGFETVRAIPSKRVGRVECISPSFPFMWNLDR